MTGGRASLPALFCLWRRRRVALQNVISVLCFFLLLPCATAQEIQEKLSVDVVSVHLTATIKGRFVKDLKLEELVLKEDGIPQQITNFTNFALAKSDKLGERDVPLTVAFVIDTSQSMGDRISGHQKIDIVKSAAFLLLNELRPEDRMLLITFNDSPTEVTPLTSDRKRFEQDLLFQDVQGGNTAVLDSTYFAMEKMKGESGRKIIVLCTDGEDTSSYLRFDEVLANLVASDVTVLAIGTMALNLSSLKGRYILDKFADASGGYAFFPSNLIALNEVMNRLREGMRSQYSLGFHPGKALDSTWRKIEIQCKRHGVKLRYREGYFAK